jgi:hypothetical protein
MLNELGDGLGEFHCKGYHMTRKMRHTQTRRTHAWHQWVVFWASVLLFFLCVASFFCVCVSTLVCPALAQQY